MGLPDHPLTPSRAMHYRGSLRSYATNQPNWRLLLPSLVSLATAYNPTAAKEYSV
ncbi:hypothetical protein MANES_07G129002v8 [Manihot esculenta]|uniref:Uncharacterized protein n=1 Tax=Manihot esculenta TaxID=3983 RepID=A0ACB7HHK7_MANES|nr:hypothetical protein MANES_07G129002v8 [Manihot esculenta]